MRVAFAMAFCAATVLGSSPCAAQSLKDFDLKSPMPMPDAQGADIDLLCFAVMASNANAAKAAGKPDPLLESAAGYYVGRLTVRFPDASASLRPVVTQLLKTMTKGDPDAFKLPCLQHYGVNLTGVLTALQAGRADAK